MFTTLFAIAIALGLWQFPVQAQVSLPAPAPPRAPQPVRDQYNQLRPAEIRGVWIHTYSAWDWDITMRRIAEAGFNCVFVRVARGVNAIYPSQFLPRDGWAEAANLDELRTAIDAAHKYGLQFHAWKVNFNSGAGMRAGAGPAAMYQKMAAEDRLVRDPQGKQAPSLNPADPRNQQLEFDVMMEMATKYDVDGIHFDYIRYPDTPHYDFDYGEVSRREFEQAVDPDTGRTRIEASGHALKNWPEDVISGPLKQTYEDWERENIDRLVERVYTAAKKARPELQVSAAVWRAHRKHRATIKQDWLKWVREGWLDFVVPMDYQTDDNEFRATVRAQVANTAGKMPIAIGIGSYKHKTSLDVARQIEIVRQERAGGYVLFDFKREGMEGLVEAMRLGPQAQPAVPSYGIPLSYIQWKFPGSVARKDDVPAYLASATTTLELSAVWKGSAKTADMWFELETPQGETKKIGRLVLREDEVCGLMTPRFRLTVPNGRSAIIIRGTVTNTSGKTESFEMLGPVLEGVTPVQLAQLKARELPPVVNGKGRRVAVYSDGMASAGLLKALDGVSGVTAYPIYRLRPEHWQAAQVLILPQLNDVTDLTPETIVSLRSWVEGGGVLLLTHDSVGFRWHPRLFPEVGQGTELSSQRKMRVLPGRAGSTAATFEHAYADHVVLQPAPGAVIVAVEATEATGGTATMPVVIAGRYGRGRVIMNGTLFGYAVNGAMPEGERRLLLELISAP